MKKLKLMIGLALLLLLSLLFTACTAEASPVKRVYVNEEGNTVVEYEDGTMKDFGKATLPDGTALLGVKNTFVDENKHLIVEYTDGTQKDLGYVGVVPPLYKVVFYDKEGNLLSEQEVYMGTSAKAPVAPEIKDMVFSGWDQDFTNVTSDLALRPQYVGAASFTVTFKDEKGNVLSTQTVITGNAATAPTPPKRQDTIFDSWDKAFDNVTDNLVVTAKYRAKKNVTVTFTDYSGLLLGQVNAKEGDSVTAPVTPTREGYAFTGWSSSLANLTASKTVKAMYRLESGDNIVDLSYTLGTNHTLTLTCAVKGTVKFCGMEGTLDLPQGFTFQSLTQADGATANCKDEKIYFMFASNSGQNVTKETPLFTVTLSFATSVTVGDFNVSVADIYDQLYTKVPYTAIGDTVKVK